MRGSGLAVLAVLAPVELSMRALVGHVLGEIDPCIHLKADLLGPVARGKRASEYAKWLKKYQNKLKDSREDFVRHHKDKYGGTLPVWAAVEVLTGGCWRICTQCRLVLHRIRLPMWSILLPLSWNLG